MNKLSFIFAVGVLVTSSCSKMSQVISIKQDGIVPATSMKISSIKPVAAKPGDEVTVVGEGFSEQSTVRLGETAVQLTDYGDGQTAKFIMPTLPRAGAFKISIGRYNDPSGSVEPPAKFMLSDSADDDYPIYMATPEEICSPDAFRNAMGDLQVGTKDCDGTTLAECTTDGEVGCITTVNLKAANMSAVSAGNIKSGVTIAGQVGDYPSVTYPLPNASGIVDLENANFDAQIKSATAFEYWNSAGARQSGEGDADITASNIVDTADIFGLTGSYDTTLPNAWDIRIGSIVKGVTGKLKVNCRNGSNLATFDQSEIPKSATVDETTDTITVSAHGWSDNQTVRIYYTSVPTGLSQSLTYYVRNSDTNTFKLSTVNNGAAIDITDAGGRVFVYKTGNSISDIWDTIDDYLAFASTTTTNAGWSSDNQCGGIEASVDDSNVWKDVTSAGTGAASCVGSPEKCTMEDKITSLQWSKYSGSSQTWPQALNMCNDLTHNGTSDWRLPTQKELMDAVSHGIKSATSASSNWLTTAQINSVYYWSATTYSNITTYAWTSFIGSGVMSTAHKTAGNSVICVRP